jgi:pyruvate oxidase
MADDPTSGDDASRPIPAGLDVVWHKVADLDDLPDGRVRTVTVGRHSLALTRVGGRYGVLDNHCPHQGGPLGEGSIEKGLLRCPWHGYDYDPLTGTPPAGFSDAPACFPVEVRADGVYAELPADAPHERTVSDVMVETMVAWGVTHVFGMVGHSNLGFADAMRRAEARGELTFVGIRHEGAAAFATSAYGKLTGRPAACFAIAGPGSTNLLTGLYDAKADRAPALALSGQVPSKVLGRGAFQDVDLNAAFAAVARYSKTVLPESDHAELMTLALKTATVERDVAHLVLPDEVQELVVGDATEASSPVGRIGDDRIAPPFAALDDALRLIEGARRPVIVVGHGVRFEMDAVLELAETLHAPVLTTFKGKGLVSDRHPLGAGVLGRSGTPVASWLMNESDLLIVFGASFSNHTGIAPYKPIVQVDFDAMALGRFHPVTVPVQGHAGVTARLLVERLAPGGDRVDQRADVAARWEIWRAEKARRLLDDRGLGVSAVAVFDALNRTVPDDAVMAVDVGNHAYSFGRYFECAGQSILMSGYLGSIGFGFPAAMGAWAAVGDTRKVLAVTGDGGFGQYLAELTTAVKYRMPITHVLLDNHSLGKITKEQRAAEYDVWHTDLLNPDFAAYAELCGAMGIAVTSKEQLDDALHRAIAHDGPALVAITTDPELV